MKIKMCFTAILVAAVMLCAVSVPACAYDVPDLTKEGNISVTMRYQGNVVPGGRLTLYRVGDIDEDDGSYDFVLNSAFEGSGVSLADLSSAELPALLAEYAKKQKPAGTTQSIGDDGKVCFKNILPGVYLLVQDTAAQGYNRTAPFLVSLPYMEDGSYCYSVDASPKAELKKAPDVPGKPDKPDRPDNPGRKLPQTGQLNWPVPILAISGLLLFSIGWELHFGKRRMENED